MDLVVPGRERERERERKTLIQSCKSYLSKFDEIELNMMDARNNSEERAAVPRGIGISRDD